MSETNPIWKGSMLDPKVKRKYDRERRREEEEEEEEEPIHASIFGFLAIGLFILGLVFYLVIFKGFN